MDQQQAPPEGLDDAGLKLWREVTEGLVLRPDERELLGQACATADTIASLEAVLSVAEAVVPGSKGQATLHPAIPELRLQRALLGSLLSKLDVPEEEGEGSEWDGLSASKRARKAAHVRWQQRAS
jgi:hypothetical protein